MPIKSKIKKSGTIKELSDLLPLTLPRTLPSELGWGFRGQADASWQLLPSAGRNSFNALLGGTSKHPYDRALFNDWKRQAIAYCPDLPDDELECLAYAQHHGLNTCLLDWTSNPFVALFFAVNLHPRKARLIDDNAHDGALFFHLPQSEVHAGTRLDDIKTVARFHPRSIHPRIIAQSSFFTVHPNTHQEFVPTRFNFKKPIDLLKFIIPAEAKFKLRRELRSFGIDEMRLFPGPEGIAKMLNAKYDQESLQEEFAWKELQVFSAMITKPSPLPESHSKTRPTRRQKPRPSP